MQNYHHGRVSAPPGCPPMPALTTHGAPPLPGRRISRLNSPGITSPILDFQKIDPSRRLTCGYRNRPHNIRSLGIRCQLYSYVPSHKPAMFLASKTTLSKFQNKTSMPHIKQIVAIRRKPSLTRQEFFDYHFQVHGKLSQAPSPDITPSYVD